MLMHEERGRLARIRRRPAEGIIKMTSLTPHYFVRFIIFSPSVQSCKTAICGNSMGHLLDEIGNQYQIAVSDFVFRQQILGKPGKKTLMPLA
jgi:hypothetical protein